MDKAYVYPTPVNSKTGNFKKLLLVHACSTHFKRKRWCSNLRCQHLLVCMLVLVELTTVNELQAQSSQDLNWISDASVYGVQFNHAMALCDGKKVVFLKLNNKNSYKVEVSWKEVFTTQKEQQAEGYAGQKTIAIEPGETKETNCNNPLQEKLLIRPEQVNPSYVVEIFKFNYKAITVVKLN